MGWYVRKSIRMGPVRWNLSKSGIGVSVGVRGLRVGTGPRGAYIAGGRKGLYFRHSLGRSTARRSGGQGRSYVSYRSALPALPARPATPSVPVASSAPVQYLPETQINAFTPATADALARYITEQRRPHTPFFGWVVGILIAINLIVLGNLFGSLWSIGLLVILTIPASV